MKKKPVKRIERTPREHLPSRWTRSLSNRELGKLAKEGEPACKREVRRRENKRKKRYTKTNGRHTQSIVR